MSVHTAQGTAYTLYRDNGRPDCHSPAQVKRNARSAVKRRVRAEAWALAHHAGVVNLHAGTGLCTMCGAAGLLLDAPDNDLSLELAHDVSDADDGAFCVCNLVPAHRACNKALGDLPLTESVALACDPREHLASWGWEPVAMVREEWGPLAWQSLTPAAAHRGETYRY